VLASDLMQCRAKLTQRSCKCQLLQAFIKIFANKSIKLFLNCKINFFMPKRQKPSVVGESGKGPSINLTDLY
jgi:hypothetical protein